MFTWWQLKSTFFRKKRPALFFSNICENWPIILNWLGFLCSIVEDDQLTWRPFQFTRIVCGIELILVLLRIVWGLKQGEQESVVCFLERIQETFSQAYGPAADWSGHHRKTLIESVVKGVCNRRLADLIATYQIPVPFSFINFRDVVVQFAQRVPNITPERVEAHVTDACYSKQNKHLELQRQQLVLRHVFMLLRRLISRGTGFPPGQRSCGRFLKGWRIQLLRQLQCPLLRQVFIILVHRLKF